MLILDIANWREISCDSLSCDIIYWLLIQLLIKTSNVDTLSPSFNLIHFYCGMTDSQSYNKRHKLFHTTSYDLMTFRWFWNTLSRPKLTWYALMQISMRLNRRRVMRPDEKRELERDTRDVVSRRKLSLPMQESIAITIHVDHYCYPRSSRPVGYMVFTSGDRTYCATDIDEGRVLVAWHTKVRQVDHLG